MTHLSLFDIGNLVPKIVVLDGGKKLILNLATRISQSRGDFIEVIGIGEIVGSLCLVQEHAVLEQELCNPCWSHKFGCCDIQEQTIESSVFHGGSLEAILP
ncbi:hypothetical protein Tco_0140667 [Tanacetum coccineum]